MSARFDSAYNLGIRITLVGPEGHFLRHQSTCHLAVEQYLALDMTLNTGLAERTAMVLNDDGIPFNNMTTFEDFYLTYMAEVTKLLGLSTAPLDAVKICADKHSTRELMQSSIKPLRINDVQEQEKRLKSTTLMYPVIVKPCKDHRSEGVFRANDKLELYRAVSKSELVSDGGYMLIDTFVNGPEFDANSVLLDGKILFFELVEFLCTAEDEHLEDDDFLETDQMWPFKSFVCREIASS